MKKVRSELKETNFAVNLKLLRIGYGYSQSNLGHLTGALAGNICRYEHGGEATVSSIIVLARVLKVTLDELIYGKLKISKTKVNTHEESFEETVFIISNDIAVRSWTSKRYPEELSISKD